jgi:hypothetical protein
VRGKENRRKIGKNGNIEGDLLDRGEGRLTLRRPLSIRGKRNTVRGKPTRNPARNRTLLGRHALNQRHRREARRKNVATGTGGTAVKREGVTSPQLLHQSSVVRRAERN